MLASEVMDLAAGFLNDTAKASYNYVVQVPYLKVALKDMQAALEVNGAPRIQKSVENLVYTALANTLAAPPADLLQPINLYEKDFDAQTDDYFTEIRPRAWDPTEVVTDRLRFYDWREDTIYFLGSTVNRSVRLDYYAVLAVIVNETSTIPVNNALNYLAFRTAEIMARAIGSSAMKDRANWLGSEAESALDKFISVRVKGQQALPVRTYGYDDDVEQ